MSSASSKESGCSKTRALVEIRMNAQRDSHANRTNSAPESVRSSQARLTRCSADLRVVGVKEQTRRSTRIIGATVPPICLEEVANIVQAHAGSETASDAGNADAGLDRLI